MPRFLMSSFMMAVLATSPLSACGGGCSGSSAAISDALEKLPASADGVIVVTVGHFMDESERTSAAQSIKEAEPTWDVDWIKGIEQLAVVWRTPAGGATEPKFGGVVWGSFDSQAALAAIKAQRPGGAAAEGFDYVTDEVAYTVVGPHALAVGQKPIVSEIAKSWKGEADGLKKNTVLYSALQKVDLSASAVLASTKLGSAGLTLPLETAAASYDFRDGLEFKAWLKADPATFEMMEKGIQMAKMAIAMAPKDQLAGMGKRAGVTAEQIDEGLEAVGELLGSLEFKHSDGEGTLEAETSVDLKSTFKDVYDGMLKAQLDRL